MKTTTNKTTKRIETAKANNAKRIAKTREQIEQQTSNTDNFINAKAIETIQALKQHGHNSKEFTSKSQNLCKILVLSKLKRLYNNEKTSNEMHRIVRNQVAQYMDENGTRIETYLQQLEKLYYTTYNTQGDKIIKCKDKTQAQEIEKQITKIASIGNDNGHDLLTDAYLKLWEYIYNEMSTKALDEIADNLLLIPFEIVIPRTQVYNNGHIKPSELWQYQTTNIIKEVSKEIGRKLENEKQRHDTTKAYDEIETEIDGQAIRQYHRTKARFCDEITDINGKITAIVNNEQVQELFNDLPTKCNLSKMEYIVYKLHYIDGLSFDEIADKYQVSINTIKNKDQRLKNKIAKSGIFASFGLNEQANNEQQATTIFMYLATDNGQKGDFVTSFSSLGQASKILNIDKSNISKVLKGKIKQTKGYIFTYNK